MKAISDYGVEEGDFLKLPEGVSVKIDTCKSFEGVVEEFEEINPGWFKLVLENVKVVFRVNNNWVSLFGPLKVGDEVEGLIDTSSGYMFRILKRKESEAV